MKMKTIQNSLIIAFTTLITLTIVVLGLLSFYLFGEALTGQSKSNAAQTIEQLNYVLEAYISYMDNLAFVATYNADVQTYLKNRAYGSDSSQADPQLERNISDFLKLIKSVRRDIASIILLFDNGQILTDNRTDRINPNIDFNKLDWFGAPALDLLKASLSSAHVQYLIAGKYPWVITLSRELRSSDDKQRKGLLLVDLNYSIIQDLCSHVQLGKSGYVFIINKEGEIVYHPRQELVYNQLKIELIDKVRQIHDGLMLAQVQGTKVLYTIKTSVYTGWTTVGVSYLDELFYNKSKIQYYYFLIAIFCFLAVVFLSIFISSRISRPIKVLRSSMQAVEKGNFDIDIHVNCKNEVAALANDCHIAIKKIKELIIQNKKEQELKRKYELETLQAQINPHFLYNTLDSIIWMIECKEYKDAVIMADTLANLFRLSLNKGKDIISIRDMIEHIRCYLTIQKKRYKDKLDYRLEIEPAIYDFKTINLLIQPLVENAIYHGIKNKERYRPPDYYRQAGRQHDYFRSLR